MTATNGAAHEQPRSNSKAEIDNLLAELAVLSDIEYGQRRAAAAKELGVPVATLDREVRKLTRLKKKDDAALPHWNVEPCSGPVAGAGLLDDIRAMFRRYIVLPTGAVEALALWVLHAWTMDAGDISPFLILVSPTKQCGKTTTLTVLLYLTPKSELASNISPSALFRYIEKVRPTLLIDEADSFFQGNEELRGILNSGHTRSAAYVIRNIEVEGEHEPRRFSTWAAKAIATIRQLADTLQDRGVVVTLQRMPRTAKVERLRYRDNEEFAELRSRASRWAEDNFDKLIACDPSVPDALSGRAADNWRPLLAIADLASPAWARRAREAALALAGEAAASEDDLGVELLKDIAKVFAAREESKSPYPDRIATKVLVGELVADEDRPWAAFGKAAKPISPRQLGKLLAPYGITPGTIRFDNDATPRGYYLSSFQGAFSAYLGTSYPPHRHNDDGTGTSRDFSSATEAECGGYEKCEKPNNDEHCGGVADEKWETGPEREVATGEPPCDEYDEEPQVVPTAPQNGGLGPPALGPGGSDDDLAYMAVPGWSPRAGVGTNGTGPVKGAQPAGVINGNGANGHAQPAAEAKAPATTPARRSKPKTVYELVLDRIEAAKKAGKKVVTAKEIAADIGTADIAAVACALGKIKAERANRNLQ